MSQRNACSDFEWMVGPLVDGELPSADAAELERHLSGCAVCTRLVDDFRSLDRLAKRAAAPPPVRPEEWARVWENVRREPAAVLARPSRRFADWLVPVTSLAALGLLTTWIYVQVMNQPERPNPNAVEVIRTAPGDPGRAPPRDKPAPAPKRGVKS